jgi:hypothetical protein
MSYSHLYKILVPNSPIHRRSERDILVDSESVARRASERFLLDRTIQPGLQKPQLISSYEGSIDRLLFCFPSYVVSDSDLVAAYKSLIAALRTGTQFIVIHHESVKNAVASWFDAVTHPAANITFISFRDYVSFTDWAEDAYVSLIDAADDTSYLMEPWSFPRAGDALIAESVQDFSDITATQAPLVFQGGNCLIGSNFWLLGKDYFADSVALTQNSRPPVITPGGTTPESFVNKLFTDYVDGSRKLTILGTNRAIPIKPFYGTKDQGNYYIDIAGDGTGTFQPIFHIDMLISLIGVNTDGDFEVLLGSPDLADQLLGTASPYALQNVYDELESQLTAAGLKVYRNPLVHRPTLGDTFTVAQLRSIANQQGNEALLNAVNELVSVGAVETSTAIVRTWHHITWNNCLVENSTVQGKHVYLPTFGHAENSDLKVIDQNMKETWEKLGFTVHLLGDFNKFAERQGVVHCIKKYLKRGA